MNRPFSVLVGLYVLVAVACGGSTSKPTIISTNVLDELQPGTTLHMVEVHYQRHGPVDDVLKLSDSYQPETLRNESWFGFDTDGKLASARSESRAPDGKLFASSHLENGQIVYEREGKPLREDHKTDVSDVTLSIIKARLQDALAKTKSDVAAHSHAPRTTIRGMDVVLTEQSRHAWTFQQGPLEPGNYVSTYVYDLHPAEEVRRHYALLDGSYVLREEWVAVDADGAETIIESWDHLVFEVIKP